MKTTALNKPIDDRRVVWISQTFWYGSDGEVLAVLDGRQYHDGEIFEFMGAKLQVRIGRNNKGKTRIFLLKPDSNSEGAKQ